jgi:hypothetical protein
MASRKPQQKTYGPCATPECDRDAEHKESGLCKRCYAFQYYWTGRSVTDKMKRVKQIEYWNARAHSMLMPSGVATTAGRIKRRA